MSVNTDVTVFWFVIPRTLVNIIVSEESADSTFRCALNTVFFTVAARGASDFREKGRH